MLIIGFLYIYIPFSNIKEYICGYFIGSIRPVKSHTGITVEIRIIPGQPGVKSI